MRTGIHYFDLFPVKSELSMTSTVLLGLIKISGVKKEPVVPYLLAGMGIHRSELKWDVRPLPGIQWSSGNPTDARPLLESGSKTGVAIALGAGVDWNINADYLLSLEGRFDFLSRNDYQATSLGQSLGLQKVDAGAGHANILVFLSRRFGTVTRAAEPHQASPATISTPVPSGMM